ncbi:MAG: SIR2 family protein [Flavobacteriales bacterium]|nr:SIR2 family protein [Flavobacteriales bacterium]
MATEEKKPAHTEPAKEEIWKHILINGPTRLEVSNPKSPKGRLEYLDKIRPFNTIDSEGKTIKPTVDLAEKEKRKLYQTFFKKPFKNLLILSGAGSSVDVGGKMISELWDLAEKEYTEKGFKAIKDAISYTEDGKNLESLLSRIDGYQKFAVDKEVELEPSKKKLSEIRERLFKLIKDNCNILVKPKDPFPHKVFLEKVLQRKQTSSRVKIFTLNYDRLFEQAATEANAIVIDGFSFTTPRTFSGRFFDYDIVQREGSKLKEEDNFVQRVFHLHKLHGSLDWHREKDGPVIIDPNTKDPLMVYPRDAKYEDSYEQPFFEMMARFQRNLRLNDDTLLICVGYSFNDKHINTAIEEALNQNPSFRLAVIDPGFDNENSSKPLKTIVAEAKRSERILMVAETFSDFAEHFPEIQTYKDTEYRTISLRNERKED